MYSFFFFFNDTATTAIYTLSLHDALPICKMRSHFLPPLSDSIHAFYRRYKSISREEGPVEEVSDLLGFGVHLRDRSEEHTSELQSQSNLVCRLLLEKKKNIQTHDPCLAEG